MRWPSIFRPRAEPLLVRKPVFIVGCGRSGTTLLFQLMKEHPGLRPTTGYPDGEDHVGWNEHADAMIGGFGLAAKQEDHTGHCYCLYRDERDVTAEIVERMTRYYSEDVLRGDASKRVLNKCPHLSNKLRFARGIFPDAKFIHIVRDCLPVVASWKVVLDKEHTRRVVYWPDTAYPCLWILPAPGGRDRAKAFEREGRLYPGGGLLLFADYWIQTNANMAPQLHDAPQQLLLVRYEDLCADTDATLLRIFEFCELPYRPGASSLRVEAGRNERYGDVLTRDEIVRIEEHTRAARAAFGYADRS